MQFGKLKEIKILIILITKIIRASNQKSSQNCIINWNNINKLDANWVVFSIFIEDALQFIHCVLIRVT